MTLFFEELRQLKQQHATLASVFDFYARLAQVEEETSAAWPPAKRLLTPEQACERLMQKKPILQDEALPIREEAYLELAEQVRRVLSDAPMLEGGMRAAAEALAEDRDGLLQGIRQMGQVQLDDSPAGSVKAFLTAETFRVFLRHFAAPYQEDIEPWQEGFCGVCGSLPDLAVAEGAKLRTICLNCESRWLWPAGVCPICQRQGEEVLIVETDRPRVAVQLCEGCRSYLKIVRPRGEGDFYLPSQERILTIPLDIKLGERGFRQRKVRGLP